MEPNAPILKKTLFTVAVMLAAWVAFIGTVSTVAVLVTSHAVAAPEPAAPAASEKPAATPGATKTGGASPQRI